MPTKIQSSFLLCAVLSLSCAAAQTSAPVNPAVIPTDKPDQGWVRRHEAAVEAARTHPDTELLLIGDSITQNYEKANPPDESFQPTWKEFYESRKALNLGVSGDGTEHVRWRLLHGEVRGLHPKAVVLLIGTVNTGSFHATAEQTEAGIDAVVGDLEQLLPTTRILLLGLLPSDISAEKTAADRAVNAYLARVYAEDPRVTYLDIGSIFFKDGVLDASLFYDPRLPNHPKPLHPDTVGQRRMAEAIEPTLARLMGEPPRVPLDSIKDINTALISVPQLEQDSYNWWARHQAELVWQERVQPRVVLIGDSITHFWAGNPGANHVNGPNAWDRVFGQMPSLNLGFGWDRTQNVLWRLRQGEFEGIKPAWVVINIGTNNLTGTDNARTNTPEEIAAAIGEIVRVVHERSSQSRILLMGIFPRGEKPGGSMRTQILAVNALLAQRFAHVPYVTFLDIGSHFLTADGTLPNALFPDQTHPGEAGYAIWADALIQAGIHP
jgi:lysophospholipase L1-like esterase